MLFWFGGKIQMAMKIMCNKFWKKVKNNTNCLIETKGTGKMA
jgi:hypothetical protein